MVKKNEVKAEGQPQLSSLAQVRQEMARVYRMAKRGELKTNQATSLVWILSQIAMVAKYESENKQDEQAKTNKPEVFESQKILSIAGLGK